MKKSAAFTLSRQRLYSGLTRKLRNSAPVEGQKISLRSQAVKKSETLGTFSVTSVSSSTLCTLIQ
jgi:hypothetical protein